MEAAPNADPGLFGPGSMMWQVNREMTTLFGGARALLMHAAHPLVAAGARQTGGYRRDPWARLIKTLQQQNLIIFGDGPQAERAAERVNKLHRTIKGIDPVTGEWYDALDYEQLLWVHAALEVSTIDFYEATVRRLSAAERDRYHEENSRVAELLLLPRDFVPSPYPKLVAYVDDLIGSGRLVATDVSAEVGELVTTGAVPAHIKPIWKFVAFAAVGLLDPRLRELYGFPWSRLRQQWLDLNVLGLRTLRPFAPPRLRTIMPARWADDRMRASAGGERARDPGIHSHE